MAESMAEQQERAIQSRLHQTPYEDTTPGEAPNVLPFGSIEELLKDQEQKQQAAYERRVGHARSQGDLLDYRETVFAGKPYAWVGYKGDKLRLLPLTEEGITRPA